MEELLYLLTQYFVSCVHVRFYFHCCPFSPCWTLAFLIFSPLLWISMFLFLRNLSPLFSITRSSSFSVLHVSVNIKNNAEKDTTLLLFFLPKSPGGHVISFQIKPWFAFGLPYLLIELFYIGMPVVRTGLDISARPLAQKHRTEVQKVWRVTWITTSLHTEREVVVQTRFFK